MDPGKGCDLGFPKGPLGHALFWISVTGGLLAAWLGL